METKNINKSDTIRFLEGESIKPKNLIVFSEDYIKILPFLKFQLQENVGKFIDLIIMRINDDGIVNEKKITGKVEDVFDSYFNFTSNHDFFNHYDFEKTWPIHFNNVLGDVPMLVFTRVDNPFRINGSDYFGLYLKKLLEIKKFLKGNLGETKFARLYLKFEDRTVEVECKILEVNNSNIKIFHLRTFDPNGSIDIVPREKFIKFITPKFYLLAVSISEIKIKVNPFDDDDC